MVSFVTGLCVGPGSANPWIDVIATRSSWTIERVAAWTSKHPRPTWMNSSIDAFWSGESASTILKEIKKNAYNWTDNNVISSERPTRIWCREYLPSLFRSGSELWSTHYNVDGTADYRVLITIQTRLNVQAVSSTFEACNMNIKQRILSGMCVLPKIYEKRLLPQSDNFGYAINKKMLHVC